MTGPLLVTSSVVRSHPGEIFSERYKSWLTLKNLQNVKYLRKKTSSPLEDHLDPSSHSGHFGRGPAARKWSPICPWRPPGPVKDKTNKNKLVSLQITNTISNVSDLLDWWNVLVSLQSHCVFWTTCNCFTNTHEDILTVRGQSWKAACHVTCVRGHDGHIICHVISMLCVFKQARTGDSNCPD